MGIPATAHSQKFGHGSSADHRDVIVIGGSLGSIEPVKHICRNLPADLGAAVFVVIHIGDRGKNMLASIFDAGSPLQVITANDAMAVRHGCVYVAPAGHHMLLIDNVIRLGRGPRENMARPAIDPLFRSAAASCGNRVIAVVLSGLLGDGASGLADVKRCGGITMVQEPSDSQVPDMPLAALHASDVDYRATLADLPALLSKLSREAPGPLTPVPKDILSEVEIALGRKSDSETVAEFSAPVALSCPACGGVMSQIRRTPLRFRCQVGHAYSAESLVSAKVGTVDEAIRVSLRIMEERILLAQKMADEARKAGMEAAASSYITRVDESRAYEAILRKAIAEPSY